MRCGPLVLCIGRYLKICFFIRFNTLKVGSKIFFRNGHNVSIRHGDGIYVNWLTYSSYKVYRGLTVEVLSILQHSGNS